MLNNHRFFMNDTGMVYVGDQQSGDRELTEGEVFEIFGTPLENARKNAKRLLRQKRKDVEYGGFTFLGMRWDSEVKDELRLNSIITRMNNGGIDAVAGWKVADGVYISLDLVTALTAADAMLAHYAGAFALEADKLQEIEHLKTAEEVLHWMENSLDKGWNMGE